MLTTQTTLGSWNIWTLKWGAACNSLFFNNHRWKTILQRMLSNNGSNGWFAGFQRFSLQTKLEVASMKIPIKKVVPLPPKTFYKTKPIQKSLKNPLCTSSTHTTQEKHLVSHSEWMDRWIDGWVARKHLYCVWFVEFSPYPKDHTLSFCKSIIDDVNDKQSLKTTLDSMFNEVLTWNSFHCICEWSICISDGSPLFTLDGVMMMWQFF